MIAIPLPILIIGISILIISLIIIYQLKFKKNYYQVLTQSYLDSLDPISLNSLIHGPVVEKYPATIILSFYITSDLFKCFDFSKYDDYKIIGYTYGIDPEDAADLMQQKGLDTLDGVYIIVPQSCIYKHEDGDLFWAG